MNSNMDFFGLNKRFIIGMVHCLPLPGTPGFGGDCAAIINHAVEDAATLEKAGVDAIIVENMGDTPFGIQLDTEQTAALAAVSAVVREHVKLPIGIDAAMNDYKAAISIAFAVGGDFVRIPVFVDTVEFYGGIITPCARDAMLFRKKLGAGHIKVLADIQVKHTHMVLTHVSVEDSAKAAAGCGADAIIVTGTHIGVEAPVEIIARVKKTVKIPVIAGSGVTAKNISEQLSIADGTIVGSGLKAGGDITSQISYDLTRELIEALQG